MLKSIVVSALILMGATSAIAQPTITNIEAEGNLAPTHDLECMAISDMQNTYTPADVARAFQRCLAGSDYAHAAEMYLFIIAYGDFDRSRVSDWSARAALNALLDPITSGALPQSLDSANEELTKLKNSESDEHAFFCSEIQRIDPPDYFPTYMVQHGMGALMGKLDDPLIATFDGDEKWAEVLSLLSCL